MGQYFGGGEENVGEVQMERKHVCIFCYGYRGMTGSSGDDQMTQEEYEEHLKSERHKMYTSVTFCRRCAGKKVVDLTCPDCGGWSDYENYTGPDCKCSKGSIRNATCPECKGAGELSIKEVLCEKCEKPRKSVLCESCGGMINKKEFQSSVPGSKFRTEEKDYFCEGCQNEAIIVLDCEYCGSIDENEGGKE